MKNEVQRAEARATAKLKYLSGRGPRKYKKAVVLLSGGLDSAVLLYLARRKGYACTALIFDYGQRHRREIAAAKKIAQSANCKLQTARITLPWQGSSLLDKKTLLPGKQSRRGKGTIPSTYVPGRNIIFLSFALSCAEAVDAQAVFIGAHAQDYSGYPDCRLEFIRTFRRTAKLGTKAGIERKPIRIEAPLIHKDKASIIRLGRKLRVPFELTWSCYKGGRRPCGSCDSCYYRSKGFREAGFNDPALKR